jgi:hypothetical protein
MMFERHGRDGHEIPTDMRVEGRQACGTDRYASGRRDDLYQPHKRGWYTLKGAKSAAG